MARLTRLGNQYRLRYRIYFPDGQSFERSRLINTLSTARQKKIVANELETHTAGQTYTSQQVHRWANIRLLSKRDQARLEGVLPGFGKTITDCWEEWERTWIVGAEEAKTRHYRRKRILSILGPDTPIKHLDYNHGLELIGQLRTSGLKIATIRKYVQDLKSAVSHQVAIRYLNYSPFATLSAGRIPVEEKIEQIILSSKQISLILNKAAERDNTDRPWLAGTLTLHLLLFFGLGIRRKEAQGLEWKHINWQERSIRLPAAITKTRKARTIGLGKRLYDELRARKKRSGHILPRFDPWSVSRAIKNHFLDCGIKARLHDARHTYTTMIQDVGVTPHRAMERTGHANIKMLSHYSHGDFGEVYEDKFDFMRVGKTKKAKKPRKTKKSGDRQKGKKL